MRHRRSCRGERQDRWCTKSRVARQADQRRRSSDCRDHQEQGRWLRDEGQISDNCVTVVRILLIVSRGNRQAMRPVSDTGTVKLSNDVVLALNRCRYCWTPSTITQTSKRAPGRQASWSMPASAHRGELVAARPHCIEVVGDSRVDMQAQAAPVHVRFIRNWMDAGQWVVVCTKALALRMASHSDPGSLGEREGCAAGRDRCGAVGEKDSIDVRQ